MRKFVLFVLIIIASAVVVACDAKKEDNGGGASSYILSDLSVTGVAGFDVNSKKLILDKGGEFTVNGANVDGTLMLGGNKFINVSDMAAFPFETLKVSASDVVSQPDGSIKFTYAPNADISYEVTASQSGLLKTWETTPLCVGGKANGCNQIGEATKLMGRYYIQQIKILGYSADSTNCNDKIITNADNTLVGELLANPSLAFITEEKVPLSLSLKFQFTAATNIGTCPYPTIFYEKYTDTIDYSSGELNLEQIFLDEGMEIIGTETVKYTPKEKLPGATAYTDKLINGAKLEITLKKATDNSSAETFTDAAPYYN